MIWAKGALTLMIQKSYHRKTVYFVAFCEGFRSAPRSNGLVSRRSSSLFHVAGGPESSIHSLHQLV